MATDKCQRCKTEHGGNTCPDGQASRPLIKRGDVVEYRDGRIFPSSIEHVTHFETTAADGTVIELPIAQLITEHKRAVEDNMSNTKSLYDAVHEWLEREVGYPNDAALDDAARRLTYVVNKVINNEST